MGNFDRKIYNILLEEGTFSADELNGLIEKTRDKNVSLYSCLLADGRVGEDKLLSVISRAADIPYVNLHETEIEEAAIKAVPAKFTWYYNFVPVKLEGTTLTIAVSEPLGIHVQDELRLILGYRLSPVLAKKDHITELLKRHYGLAADMVDKMVAGAGKPAGERAAPVAPEEGIEDIEKLAGDASVIRLVNHIILEAYRKRATDIHIEPFRGKLKLRYRIDGVLQDQKVPADVDSFILPILSRIKIMSNLNIVERRVPQDGRAIVKTQEEVLDLRVSFIPTPHGESVVIRMLPTRMFFGLKRLGLAGQDIEIFRELIKKPSGIVFVTGPTGSGKSTTLYACLQEVDKVEKKVITIEDPIEYEMGDITQIQVNESTGLTFAKGLRSMLRHDPDIMMVGEVRDRETAEIAIRVALTGHLVLSTLHTNDAATGVTRLVDIGIEPYLVASSVEAFIAQRLVRVICSNCKEETGDTDPELRAHIARTLGLKSDTDVKFFRGKGCESCNFTGFYGRTAIYEILMVDRDIKRLIIEKVTASEIKRKSVENGMRTLIQDGWHKVINGVTTPEEVMKVCQDLEPGAEWGPSTGVAVPVEAPRTAPDTGLSDTEIFEKRVHMRVPARLTMQYRLVEKGEGDILKISGKSDKKHDAGASVFTEEIFTREVSGGDFDREVYRDVISSTLNISAGGAVFESEYLIPVDSILELMMEIPGTEKPIKCFAKIIRVEKDLPRAFNIAVCYLDMSGEDRKAVDDFVRKEHDKQRILDIKKYK